MTSWSLFLTFMLATVLFAYMPGPALLYTAAQTIARGRRAGFMAALGIHIGGYAHVLAAALGLSALFVYVPQLYVVLKLVGAVYLIWLGVSLLRAPGPAITAADVPQKTARRAFFESVMVELLNPKVALFFIAFLPQFVDPTSDIPVWLQFLVLGMLVNLTSISADLVTVVFASAVTERLTRGQAMVRLMRWLGGGILIGLGVKLALSRQASA
ncbi:MAG: LysE family translocator [Pseudomonadota bacterium]